MKILIAGASGFIGKALFDHLIDQGHDVLILSRSKNDRGVYWNPEKKVLDLKQIEGVEVVISLNGTNVAKKRWNKAFKHELLSSRVRSSTFLAQSVASLKKPPKLFIQASGAGFYGKCFRPVDENSPPGDLYLSKICSLWEHSVETLPLETRKVFLRFGMVLGKNGGALQRTLPIFKLGLGAVMGKGKNMISWITIDDVIGSIDHIIKHKEISGPVNMTSPYPVTSKKFYKTLAKTLSRPCFLSIPSIFIELIFGQMGKELLDTSSNVYPQKLLNYGYTFIYPDINKAFNHLLEKES